MKVRTSAIFLLVVVLFIQSIHCISLSDVLGKDSNVKFNKNNAALLQKFVQPSEFQAATMNMNMERGQTKGAGAKEAEWYVAEGDSSCCTGDPITFEDEKFVITVGMYLDQINSLDVEGSNFFAKGYIWIIWKSCYTLPDGELFNPFQTIEAQNVAQQWATTLTPQSTSPECSVKDGVEFSYMLFGMNMNIGMKFEYQKYPLDQQELYLSVEDLVYDNRFLEYKVDTDTNYSPDVVIPKFDIQDTLRSVTESTKHTTFGLGGERPKYSRASMGIVINRKVSYFIIEFLPPIVIIVLTCVVAFVIDPINAHERLFIVPGSILSLVFLQIGFAADTPDVGSMNVTDWVINWCYFLILVMMTEIGIIVLIMAKWESRSARVDAGGYSEPEDIKKSQSILKWRRRLCFIIDAITMIWTFLGATVGLTVVIIIARYS